MKIGFDSEKYMQIQSKHILERIDNFGGKLYLEFGGKLFDDLHASRVLPGFDENAKIKLLQKLKDKCEIIFCISASDIERNKIRADYGITYGAEILRLIDAMTSMKIKVNSIVITKFEEQPSAIAYKNKLEARGIKVYMHGLTKGYPTDVDTIVSDEGYGKNPYIETTRPLVVVNAPGPNSGKLATCLGQLYHEYKRGVKAGYAKFETFPIWNLPLKHPVNIAYEAATADLDDLNMIDPFHLEAHGTLAVNYNRDVEIFPVLKAMMEKISGTSPYLSPTDMGVNMAGFCIFDDDAVSEASKREVLRRYYQTQVAIRQGEIAESQKNKLELLLQQLKIDDSICPAIEASRKKAAETNAPAGAMVLPTGKVVTGKNSVLLGPSAALLLNAV